MYSSIPVFVCIIDKMLPCRGSGHTVGTQKGGICCGGRPRRDPKVRPAGDRIVGLFGRPLIPGSLESVAHYSGHTIWAERLISIHSPARYTDLTCYKPLPQIVHYSGFEIEILFSRKPLLLFGITLLGKSNRTHAPGKKPSH